MTVGHRHDKRTWLESLYVPDPARDWVLNVVANRISRYDGYRAFVTRGLLACGLTAVFAWYLVTDPDPRPWTYLGFVPLLLSLLQSFLEIRGEWLGRHHDLHRSIGHALFGDPWWRRRYPINLTGLMGTGACVLNILAVTFLLPADLGLVKILALLLAMLYLNSGCAAVLVDAPFYNRVARPLHRLWQALWRPFSGTALGLLIVTAQLGVFQEALPAWGVLSAPPWPEDVGDRLLVALASLLPIALSLRVAENERVLSSAYDMMLAEVEYDLRENARWLAREMGREVDRIEEMVEAGESRERVGESTGVLREAIERLVQRATTEEGPATVPESRILESVLASVERRQDFCEFRKEVRVQAIHHRDHGIASDLLRLLCLDLRSDPAKFVVGLEQQRNDEVDEYARFSLTVANAYLGSGRQQEINTILERFVEEGLAPIAAGEEGLKDPRAEVVEVLTDEGAGIRVPGIRISWIGQKVWA